MRPVAREATQVTRARAARARARLKHEGESPSMTKWLTRRLLAALVLCSLAAPALADWGVNLPVGVTPLSKEIYGLHMLIFAVCCVIAVGVFGAMIYSIATFR